MPPGLGEHRRRRSLAGNRGLLFPRFKCYVRAKPMMEYRLLGPFQVVRDGQRVEIGTGMQRALLAALLLRPNQPASTGWLIDALWDDPPASAAKIVQNCVMRLRRLLPDELLLTRDRGYALRVAPGELDVDRFSHSLALGREAMHRGNYESALVHLDGALAEWTGAPLSDVGDQPFVEEEARRLDAAPTRCRDGSGRCRARARTSRRGRYRARTPRGRATARRACPRAAHARAVPERASDRVPCDLPRGAAGTRSRGRSGARDLRSGSSSNRSSATTPHSICRHRLRRSREGW